MDGDTTNSTDGQNTNEANEVTKQATDTSALEMQRAGQPVQSEASPASAASENQTAMPQAPTATLHEGDQTALADDIPESISWTASEFIAHEKTFVWYVLLILGALVAAAVVWLFTRDMMPTLAVFIGMALLAYYASRQPRQQNFQLDSSGLTIGVRYLPFDEFRSFAVIPEGAFLSIELTPLKRFSMYTTIYLDPADEDRIIDFLSAHLPMEEPHLSLADTLMRRIHF